MSYHQHLGQLGAVVEPGISKEFFSQVLQFRGQPVDLYHAPEVRNCPCFNEAYMTADPDCSVCSGTGSITGYTVEPYASFVAAIFLDAEARQDQHQRIVTQAGPVETFDARMYCEAVWYDSIKLNDVIIFKDPSGAVTEGVEMRIITKLPRQGNRGEIIFVRCDLEKQPVRQLVGVSGVKERI